MNIHDMARSLYEAGFEPIPIAPGKKYPSIKGWPDVDCAEVVMNWEKYYNGHSIGIRTGRVSAIDIDIYDAGIVKFLLGCLDFPHLTRVGQPPKALVPLLCLEIESKLLSDAYVDQHGVINRIEVLSCGQQFVAYGIHPDTNKPYEWSSDLLSHSLPTVTKDFILYLFDLFYDLACKQGWRNLSTRERKAEKSVKSNAIRTPNTCNQPGDIYNRAVPLKTLLEHYGWTHYRGQYWTRPGKDKGVSASVFDDRILWPFTSGTVLEPEKPYDAFEILTQYEFSGDKSACARALKEAA